MKVHTKSSVGVPASIGKTSVLLPQKKTRPPVKRKPKRTNIPSHNHNNDKKNPHPSYGVDLPVSMYDVVKLEYGGEPEDSGVDVNT